MDFNNIVAPLMGKDNADGKPTIGSGFLVQIKSEIFLVTVAHLCDYVLSPRADWGIWPDELNLVDRGTTVKEGELPMTVGTFPLFFVGNRGKKVPRFRYALRPEPESRGQIQDIILLPLQSDDPMVKLYEPFDLPADRAQFEADTNVTMLGRRNVFPALSAVEHVLRFQEGPGRYMSPEGQNGDSGGPVVNSEGLLVGMNVGSHKDIPGHAMLISTEAIESVASGINGNAKEWPGSGLGTPAQTQQ